MTRQQRLSININAITALHLEEVKVFRSSTITDAVRVLVGIGHYFWRAHRDGYTILTEKDGVTNRVYFDF